jgi:RNA-binding protein
MALSEKQKKYLRRLAHPLNPIVMLGQSGLTENIVKETERALNDHELIKVSARLGDRDARDAAFASLTRLTASELVQRIGNVGVLYRRCSGLPKVVLPDH